MMAQRKKVRTQTQNAQNTQTEQVRQKVDDQTALSRGQKQSEQTTKTKRTQALFRLRCYTN